MPEVVEINPITFLLLSVLVLYLGSFLQRKIAVLERNNIPAAVVGGLVFSFGVWVLRSVEGVQLDFDMSLRDLLLLVFFSTIGLQAKFSELKAGGRSLAILVGITAVFLMIQDVVGVGAAMALGAHPGYGLFAGSISFAGGHGTAIAWGQEATRAGLDNALAVGIAFATMGLVAGGMVGGPIATRLMKTHGLTGRERRRRVQPEPSEDEQHTPITLSDRMSTLLALAICLEGGNYVNETLTGQGVLLPGFLTSLFVGIVLTNLADATGRRLNDDLIEGIGEFSLAIFLAMSMMVLELWTLAAMAGPILVVLSLQIAVMIIFAGVLVFRALGSDYDAAVISSGFAGLGLGATPVAIANMSAITDRYGPSPKAFLIVPLVGAFFVDVLNAAVIKFFIEVVADWVT